MNVHQHYERYLAVKKHFTDEKFTLGINQYVSLPVREETVAKRCGALPRLIEKYGPNVEEYFVANFTAGDAHGGLYNGDAAHEAYRQWKKRRDSLTYTVKSDLTYLASMLGQTKEDIEYLFSSGKRPPAILRAFFGKKVCIETLCLIDEKKNFSVDFDLYLKGDLLWGSTGNLLRKYRYFFHPSESLTALLPEYFENV